MSELVDLVNRKGEIVEIGIQRKLVDDDRESFTARGLFMRIAVVVILNDAQEVLWHRRHPEKVFEGGMIDHACGSVHSGEEPQEAAIREAKEEVGVDLEYLREVGSHINEYDCYRVLFAATCNAQPSFDPSKLEVIEARYSSPEQLTSMQQDGDKFVKDFFPDLDSVLTATETSPPRAKF